MALRLTVLAQAPVRPCAAAAAAWSFHQDREPVTSSSLRHTGSRRSSLTQLEVASHLCWTARQPRPLVATRAEGGRQRGLRDFPLISQLRDMWRRKLFGSTIIAALIVGLWCMQGFLGWRQLKAFNRRQPLWKRLPTSAAMEAWLWGNHSFVSIYGKSVAVTMSTLQRDFQMDTVLYKGGQVYRLLTAVFLHNGFLHVLFNLGYLCTIAPLEAGARGAFLLTFVISGIGGNLAFAQFSDLRYGLGASGALCGLLGFELISRMRMREVREFRAAAGQAFGLLIIGLLIPGVANSAHGGGLVAGIAVALACARRSGYRNALVPWQLLAAVLLLTPPGIRFAKSLSWALQIGFRSPGRLGQGLAM